MTWAGVHMDMVDTHTWTYTLIDRADTLVQAHTQMDIADTHMDSSPPGHSLYTHTWTQPKHTWTQENTHRVRHTHMDTG